MSRFLLAILAIGSTAINHKEFLSMPTRQFFMKMTFLLALIFLIDTNRAIAQENPPTTPEQVQVGVYINDIQSIDLRTHTYAMDVYIWFRWTNPDLNPAETLEFINPADLWGTIVDPSYEEPQTLDNGELYQVLRVQGRFARKMSLYNYPFDRQILEIVFEDKASESQKLTYVGEGVTLNPRLMLPGFNLAQPQLVIADLAYPTQFGDTRLSQPSSYSRARIEVPIFRPVATFALKLLLPVFSVILCALLMFLLAPTYVDLRINVGITSLLAIVVLQMTLNQDVPEIGYLMLVDKIYLCAYAFVVIGLSLVVWTARLVNQGNEAAAQRVQRRSLVIMTLVFVAAVTLLIAQGIIQG